MTIIENNCLSLTNVPAFSIRLHVSLAADVTETVHYSTVYIRTNEVIMCIDSYLYSH